MEDPSLSEFTLRVNDLLQQKSRLVGNLIDRPIGVVNLKPSGAGTQIGRKGRFQVLALDGGGLRGLFTCRLLERIEQHYSTKIHKHFDLITGTSTGGIIAIGLGLGLSASEIRAFYSTHHAAIFPRRWHDCWRDWAQWLRCKYSCVGLESSLQRDDIFSSKTLNDSFTRLLVPAFDMSSNSVKIFRTPHTKEVTCSAEEYAWRVAAATSAAPTFLPAHQHDGGRWIDGGIWANNPCLLGVAEALGLLGQQREAIHVFSVGTTEPIGRKTSKLDRGGKLQWASAAIDVAMHGSASGALHSTTMMLPRGNVVRVNRQVPEGRYFLDRFDSGLLAEADAGADEAVQKFGEGFSSHFAAQSWRV